MLWLPAEVSVSQARTLPAGVRTCYARHNLFNAMATNPAHTNSTAASTPHSSTEEFSTAEHGNM